MALGTIDHLVVSAATLAEGVAHVETTLGVSMSGRAQAGGEHPLMGTHNRLLSLGPDTYLEVISINPDAPQPPHPRWFDLDYFTGDARLTNWVVRVPDLGVALTRSPDGTGDVHDLTRGANRWKMAIPSDGRLPFSACAPGLLSWQGADPAPALLDQDIRLTGLEITHPAAEGLSVALAPLVVDPRLSVQGGQPGVCATFETPGGMVQL